MDISVIVPLYNEDESLEKLYEWIQRVMTSNQFTYEVIFVNDGSTDRSWEVIESLQQNRQTCAVSNSATIMANLLRSSVVSVRLKATWFITMDADLQDSPDEIPELFHMIKEENFDLVSGWKKKRYDSKLTKKHSFKNL